MGEPGPRRGAKEYVKILALAARRGESMVAAAVVAMLEEVAPRAPVTEVEVEPVSANEVAA